MEDFMARAYLALIVIMSLFSVGCGDTDVGMALRAAVDAVRAVTLDDEDVQRLAVEVAQQSDRKHEVALPDNPQAKRLARLTDGRRKIDGHEFDFKVYLSPTVNAFAMADGTIRIHSGLMDMMTDNELVFVIGHEIGHVVENHVKEKLRLAYAGSAVRKAIASQQNEVGDIARSAVGALTEDLLNAQFSQQEERKADDFGVMFLKQKGHDIQPAISALMKLSALVGGNQSFLSSHPASEKRAERLQNNMSRPERVEDPTLLSRIVDWLKRHWPFKNDAKKLHT
jgi:putative metalloprotease